MLLRFMSLVAGVFPAWVAFGAAPSQSSVNVSFQARISDASRLRETWLQGEPRALGMRETIRASGDDLQVELTPRGQDGEYILLAYRVLRSADGRWVSLSSGDLRARNGHPTELMVGGTAAAGHLIRLAIRAQSGRPAKPWSGSSPTGLPRQSGRPRFQRL